MRRLSSDITAIKIAKYHIYLGSQKGIVYRFPLLLEYVGHKNPILGIETKDDVLVSITASELRIWDDMGCCLWLMSVENISCLAVNPDYVFTGTTQGLLLQWDEGVLDIAYPIKDPITAIQSCNDYIFVQTTNRLLLFDVLTKTLVWQESICTRFITLSESHLFASSDTVLYCWSLKDFKREKAILSKKISSLFFAGRLLMLMEDGNIYEWRAGQIFYLNRIYEWEHVSWSLDRIVYSVQGKFHVLLLESPTLHQELAQAQHQIKAFHQLHGQMYHISNENTKLLKKVDVLESLVQSCFDFVLKECDKQLLSSSIILTEIDRIITQAATIQF